MAKKNTKTSVSYDIDLLFYVYDKAKKIISQWLAESRSINRMKARAIKDLPTRGIWKFCQILRECSNITGSEI